MVVVMATSARTRARLRRRAGELAGQLDAEQGHRLWRGWEMERDREDMAQRVAALEADHRARTGREMGRKVAEAMAHYDRLLEDMAAERRRAELIKELYAEPAAGRA
jgi:hypothetical protein